MRVSLDWLSDYIDIGGSVSEIADRFTMAGLEVEGIEYSGISLGNVVTAEVKSVEGHPDADRLKVCLVSTGGKDYPVVCGDQNVIAGDIVPLALPGAELVGGIKIKKSKIRGVESYGMLCSEKDLGLSEDNAGVMKMPEGTSLCVELGKAVTGFSPQIEIDTTGKIKKSEGVGQYSDSIFEVGLTPNRPDCLSLFGFARELSALSGRKTKFPVSEFREGGRDTADEIEIEIREPSLCHRYMARVIRGVKVDKSPLWLRKRLEAAGVRAINNIVDITNYVMLELGQPLHAFDLQKVGGAKIAVRKAKKGERLLTLDGVERIFEGNELLICDAERPVALAGVMGGEESAVSSDTRDILIESAYFDPSTVRRTARKTGLHTDSSHRFERGVDIIGVKVALERAVSLISELAGGEVAVGCIDNFPVPYEEREIPFRPKRCADLLGVEIEEGESVGYLRSIGMDVKGSGGSLVVVPPSYRVDVEREVDLIEEVARLKGYSSIPVENVAGSLQEAQREGEAIEILSAKKNMADSGFNEVLNYSFQSVGELDRILVPEDDILRKTITILNPISEDLSIMRTTLVTGLLAVASANVRKQERNLRLFEVGKVFFSGEEGQKEKVRMCALMTGEKGPLLWKGSPGVFDLKGTLENLLDLLSLNNYTFRNCSDIPFLHPGVGARVLIDDLDVGLIGEIHPSVLQKYDLDQKAYIFDIDLTLLGGKVLKRKSFSDIPVYPFVERDVALLVDQNMTFSEIMKIFRSAENPLLENVEIFDHYEGKGVDEGKKSLAFRLRYRSKEKTLTDEEVNKLHQGIIKKIIKESGATIR